MVSTLRDGVEIRVSQRAFDARRTSTERVEADRGARESFSLDDFDRRAALEAKPRASANARRDTAPASPTGSVRGAIPLAGPKSAASDVTRPDAPKPVASRGGTSRPDAARPDVPDPAASERDVAGPAARRPDVAGSNVAKPADAGAHSSGSLDERTAADTAADGEPNAVGSDVAASQAEASETADAIPSTPQDESAQKTPSAVATPPADARGRPERSSKPPASNPIAANGTSGPASSTAGSPDGAAALQKGEPTEPETASTADAIDDQADRGTSAETPPSAQPMMPVFVAPAIPASPSRSTAAAPDGMQQGGTSDVEAAAAPNGPAALATGGPGRAATTTGREFASALAETGSENSNGDAPGSIVSPGAETGPTVGATTSPSNPVETKAAAAAGQQAPPSPPVPLGAVPMTIGLRALGTSSRFEIRLDPKELGRIDVSIDIDKDSGTVGARLVVDRPETLALLHRDASSLQQALAQTGLDASAGISLSLRGGDGESQRNGGNPGAEQGRQAARTSRADTQAGPDQAAVVLAPLRTLRGFGRIDIRI